MHREKALLMLALCTKIQGQNEEEKKSTENPTHIT
jgi:hypothetical protein